MSIHIIYLIALSIVIVGGVIFMQIKYRRSIVSNVGIIILSYGVYGSLVTYTFSTFGTTQLYWIVPTSIIVLAFVLYFINRNIKNPLSSVVDNCERLAEGRLELNLEKYTRENEISFLIKSINKICDFQIKKHSIIEKIATGNGDFAISVDLASDQDEFGKSLARMLDSLNEIIGQVKGTAEQISSGAGQVSNASQVLSQGASEQASSLEEISSSITEISSRSRQNSENALQANSLAKLSRENAEIGTAQMNDLIAAMEDINESSKGIKKIVKVIDDIAFQINLLALNANVEAARAGKYGKGFAVVAEEVRDLAGRSAQSVKETNNMVEVSLNNVSKGNELVEKTSSQLNEIAVSVTKVGTLVDEVTAASNEQAQGLDQIVTGLGQIDQVTQSNTASAEESASASEELASQAHQLTRLVAKFKLKTQQVPSLR